MRGRHQNIKPLETSDLAELWQHHFRPLANPDELNVFDPMDSILNNCLPKYKVRGKPIGFEFCDCLHHYIQVQTVNYTAVAKALKDYSLCIRLADEESDVLVHLHANDAEIINEEATVVKELLHALPSTDYYEANEVGENVCFFEGSIPGWCRSYTDVYRGAPGS